MMQTQMQGMGVNPLFASAFVLLMWNFEGDVDVGANADVKCELVLR